MLPVFFISLFHTFKQQKFQVDRLKNDFQDSVQRFTTLQKVTLLNHWIMFNHMNSISKKMNNGLMVYLQRAAEQVKKTVKLASQKPKPKSSGGWMDVSTVL